jgi:hypothetical protein
MLLPVIAGALVVNLVVIYLVRENKVDATFLAICAIFQFIGVVGALMKKGSEEQKYALKTSHIALITALILSPIVAQTNALLIYTLLVVITIAITRVISYKKGLAGCIFFEYEDYEDYKGTFLQNMIESPIWDPFGGWIQFILALTCVVLVGKLYYINMVKKAASSAAKVVAATAAQVQ